MSTFITVGNAKQEFRRLFDICHDCIDLLPRPVSVQYGFTEVNYTFDATFKFMTQKGFGEKMLNASLVIGHAGAGTIMSALRYGLKPIVVPRMAIHGEHVDNHQIELAEALNATNKVYMVNSSGELRTLLESGKDYKNMAAKKTNALCAEIEKDISRLGLV